MKDDQVPLMTRLPVDLHGELKQLAESDGRSLNGMMVVLLREAVQARRRPSAGPRPKTAARRARGTPG